MKRDESPAVSAEDCSVGRVIEVKPTRARVTIDVTPCQGCSHHSECGLWMGGERRTDLWVSNGLGAVVGEQVRVSLSPGQKTKTACLLYLVPSICIVAGVLLGQTILASISGVDPTLGGLAGALVLFGVGLLPAYWVSRRGGTLPEVIEILKEG